MLVYYVDLKYSGEIWTNLAECKADIAKRYSDAVISSKLGYFEIRSPTLGVVGKITPVETFGEGRIFAKEAEYIRSVPLDNVGESFNNDPACFARYVLMQSKLAYNAGAMEAAGSMLCVLANIIDPVPTEKED